MEYSELYEKFLVAEGRGKKIKNKLQASSDVRVSESDPVSVYTLDCLSVC